MIAISSQVESVLEFKARDDMMLLDVKDFKIIIRKKNQNCN